MARCTIKSLSRPAALMGFQSHMGIEPTESGDISITTGVNHYTIFHHVKPEKNIENLT
jgi:hypothetical protein